MFERDFIKRLIQQFAEVVAKIIFYKSKKDWQQVQMVIDVSAKQLLGLNPDLIENMDAKDLVRLFSIKNEIDYEKCLILAILQYEQAILNFNTGKPEKDIFNAYLKSFILFKTAFLNKELKTDKDTIKAFECCENLLEYDLDDKILLDIFMFYKAEMAFARAEDVLFILLKKNRDEAKTTALNFYRDLLSYTDSDLKKGDLPRDEVLEGLKKLEK